MPASLVPASLCQHPLCQHSWLTCDPRRTTLSPKQAPKKPQAPQKQPLGWCHGRVPRGAGRAGKQAVLPWRVTKIFPKMKACSSVKQTFQIIFLETFSLVLWKAEEEHFIPSALAWSGAA